MPLKVDRLITNTLSVNGVEIDNLTSCGISTEIFGDYPFIIQPTLTKSCVEVTDISNNNNLQGYKINGTVVLQGDNQYSIYLGTITWKDGDLIGGSIIPSKTTGSVILFNGGEIVNNPLNSLSLAFDDDSYTPIFIETVFVNYFNPDGDDLLIDVVLFVSQSLLDPNPLVGNIDCSISFELEYLFPKDQTLTFESNPPII